MSIDLRLTPNLPDADALSALDRQLLDGRQALDGGQVQALDDTAPQPRAPEVDSGEQVLNAAAWREGEPRLLPADGFQLEGRDRGQDLEAGIEAMVSPLD